MLESLLNMQKNSIFLDFFQCHLVHYNTAFGSFDEALQKEGGIAVLAFLFTVSNTHFSLL